MVSAPGWSHKHKTRLQHKTRGVSHLIEVVVAQTVGKIQVWWFSWNRIPTSSRIKSYIHDVWGSRAAVAVAYSARRSICFCRLESQRTERERRRKRGGKTDPSFVGVNETLRLGGKGSGKVSIFLFYTWFSRFISEEAHMKVGLSRIGCPSSSSRRCVPMHLHTAAPVYKEATRPATERVGPPPFPPPSDAEKRKEKMKTVTKW